jgi:hypothetical protein
LLWRFAPLEKLRRSYILNVLCYGVFAPLEKLRRSYILNSFRYVKGEYVEKKLWFRRDPLSGFTPHQRGQLKELPREFWKEIVSLVVPTVTQMRMFHPCILTRRGNSRKNRNGRMVHREKHFIPHECGSYLQKNHINVFSGDSDHNSLGGTEHLSPSLGGGP